MNKQKQIFTILIVTLGVGSLYSMNLERKRVADIASAADEKRSGERSAGSHSSTEAPDMSARNSVASRDICGEPKECGILSVESKLFLSEVQSFQELRDGRIAVCSEDDTIKIWDLTTNKHMTLVGHTASICKLIELHDGKIASGSYDGTIRIWDLTLSSNQCVTVLIGHTDAVTSLIELHDHNLASCSHDRTVRIWDLATKKEIAQHKVPKTYSAINLIKELGDHRIAMSSSSRTVYVWNPQLSETIQPNVSGGDIDKTIELSDHRIVLPYDKDIYVYDYAANKETVRLTQGHENTVDSIMLLDNNTIASCSADSIRIWDLATYKPISGVKNKFHLEMAWDDPAIMKADPNFLEMVLDSAILTTFYFNYEKLWQGLVKTYNPVTGKNETHNGDAVRLDVKGRFTSMMRLDDTTIMYTNEHGLVGTYNFVTGDVVIHIDGTIEFNNANAWLVIPMGDNRIATRSFREIEIWDLKIKKKVAQFMCPSEVIKSIQLLRNNKIASLSAFNVLRVWEPDMKELDALRKSLCAASAERV